MKKVGQRCSLSELKIGQVAIIESLEIENKKLKRHLLDMGFVRGTIVKIKKVAPMGDPVDIELRGYEIALRKEDINKIIVEVKR